MAYKPDTNRIIFDGEKGMGFRCALNWVGVPGQPCLSVITLGLWGKNKPESGKGFIHYTGEQSYKILLALILNEKLVLLRLAMSSGTGRALLLVPHPCSLNCASKIKVYLGLVAKKPRCLCQWWVVIHKVPHSWVWRFSLFIFVTYNSSSFSGVTEMNQPVICHVLGGIQGALSVLTGVCLFPRTYFTHPGECWAKAWWERVCSYTEEKVFLVPGTGAEIRQFLGKKSRGMIFVW